MRISDWSSDVCSSDLDWGFEGAFRSRRSRRKALLTPQSRIPNPQSRPPFSWPTRVYWEDTAAGGVVYHAQYLAFLERARTEWLRAIGYGQELLRVDHRSEEHTSGLQSLIRISYSVFC